MPLARELDARERWRGATCVYRALLDDVLTRAYAPAYSHAAKYWVRLQAIANSGIDLSPLQTHAAYGSQIEKQHSRKCASGLASLKQARFNSFSQRGDGPVSAQEQP